MWKLPQALPVVLLLAAGAPGSAPQGRPTSIEAMRARIDALKAPHVAWRQIPWKSCLLEGLRESQRTGKPLMLWVFIDRPVDDQRC